MTDRKSADYTASIIPRADVVALRDKAQAVIDSNVPPTACQREAAYATIAACRVELDKRDGGAGR